MSASLERARMGTASHRHRSFDLIGIICRHPNSESEPLCITFANSPLASNFARQMRKLGYRVDISAVFSVEPTLETALRRAHDFFGDPRINDPQPRNDTVI
jgi:hypothetical protein